MGIHTTAYNFLKDCALQDSTRGAINREIGENDMLYSLPVWFDHRVTLARNRSVAYRSICAPGVSKWAKSNP